MWKTCKDGTFKEVSYKVKKINKISIFSFKIVEKQHLQY